MAVQAKPFLGPETMMDERIRNLAPPLGAGLLTLVIYLWAHGALGQARARRETHPAE